MICPYRGKKKKSTPLHASGTHVVKSTHAATNRSLYCKAKKTHPTETLVFKYCKIHIFLGGGMWMRISMLRG